MCDSINDDDSLDSWISLAELLCQPKGTDKPKISVALLKKIIETEGVRTEDQWGELIWATDNDEDDCNSKARVYKYLAQYYAEVMAENDLPPGVEADKDPNRWLEYYSPLNEFGWPKNEAPDFLEWVSESSCEKKKRSKDEDSILSDSAVEESINVGESFVQETHSSSSDKDTILNETNDLSELFDPVPVASLEKMFPANGKWKSWAEHASSNGLSKARKERGKFNPLEAALWFVGKGIKGWDWARCKRALANNLPPRSNDKKYLIIDDNQIGFPE